MNVSPANVAPPLSVHKKFSRFQIRAGYGLFFVLLLLTGCPRQIAPPLESPWPELSELDAVAARVEQRILAGVGRGELMGLSEELTFAIHSVLQSDPPETVPDPDGLRVLLRELSRGHQLLIDGQAMNPDLLLRFHGLSAAMMNAAGMADLHQH